MFFSGFFLNGTLFISLRETVFLAGTGTGIGPVLLITFVILRTGFAFFGIVGLLTRQGLRNYLLSYCL